MWWTFGITAVKAIVEFKIEIYLKEKHSIHIHIGSTEVLN